MHVALIDEVIPFAVLPILSFLFSALKKPHAPKYLEKYE